MDIKTVDQSHSAENSAAAAPSAYPVSPTEQLAQITLASMPNWMKAPGGIQRFRLIMAVVVATGAILFGALWLHLDSRI